jgi:hypothetical protein
MLDDFSKTVLLVPPLCNVMHLELILLGEHALLVAPCCMRMTMPGAVMLLKHAMSSLPILRSAARAHYVASAIA